MEAENKNVQFFFQEYILYDSFFNFLENKFD